MKVSWNKQAMAKRLEMRDLEDRGQTTLQFQIKVPPIFTPCTETATTPVRPPATRPPSTACTNMAKVTEITSIPSICPPTPRPWSTACTYTAICTATPSKTPSKRRAPDFDDDVDHTPNKKLAKTAIRSSSRSSSEDSRSSSRSNTGDTEAQITYEDESVEITTYNLNLKIKEHEPGGKHSNEKDKKLMDTNNFKTTDDHQPLHPTEGAPRHHHEAPSSIINHRRHSDHHKHSKSSIKDELQDKETGAQWDPC